MADPARRTLFGRLDRWLFAQTIDDQGLHGLHLARLARHHGDEVYARPQRDAGFELHLRRGRTVAVTAVKDLAMLDLRRAVAHHDVAVNHLLGIARGGA